MNETLISNWNSVVRPSDEVYHLGDFAYGQNDQVRKLRYRLKGKITLILGNHDYQNKVQRIADAFTEVRDLKTLKTDGKVIILCHYMMSRWDRSHYNSWHLFGHTHYPEDITGKRYNVGVDINNYTPVSLDTITKIMESKSNNDNFLGDKINENPFDEP